MRRMSCLLLVLLLLPLPARAIESTAYTYTLGEWGNYIRTQDAYMPGSVILRELELKSPEDICLYGNTLYIADTGNSRVLRFSMADGTVEEIGKGVLESPTGVCANAQGLYVADDRAQAVFVFDESGRELGRIERPDDTLYGLNTAYKPQKVAVDAYGNLYVTSEGTHEGILQFDSNGVFAGFFGANRVGELSVMDRITDAVFTQEQKDKQARRNPMRIVNLDVTDENLVLSLSQQSPDDAVKMLNMAGIDILNTRSLHADSHVVDVAAASGGIFYTVSETGNIVEYTSDGVMLFAFGGRAVSSDRNGLTSVVSAICVDERHNLYVLDKQRGVVQPYAQTDFAAQIHAGLSLYQSGQYAQAAQIWEENLRLTPTAQFAHAGLGKALWQMGDHSAAFEQLDMGGEMEYASQAYWEMRNQFLMAHLPAIFALLLGAAALLLLLAFLQKKTRWLDPVKAWHQRHVAPAAPARAARTMFRMIRHPLDTVYDIKHCAQGSMASAFILYGAALLVFLLDTALAAPLFNSLLLRHPGSNPFLLGGIAALLCALFVVGNYFVASIHDGEGSMRQVVTAMGYALSFYILCTPILTLLTYALTYNEQFIVTLLRAVIYGYTVILIYLAAKESHGYSFGQTLKNLLLTLCFVLLALLAMAILYMLWHELIGFAGTLIEEVRLRA